MGNLCCRKEEDQMVYHSLSTSDYRSFWRVEREKPAKLLSFTYDGKVCLEFADYVYQVVQVVDHDILLSSTNVTKLNTLYSGQSVLVKWTDTGSIQKNEVPQRVYLNDGVSLHDVVQRILV